MPELVQVVLFGAMVCTIGATALTLASNFRPERKGLGSRFGLFFWR